MKQVDSYLNSSLSHLKIIPGEVVGFENYYPSVPFIPAIPDHLEEGIHYGENTLRLAFRPDGVHRTEQWTLFARERFLGLFYPNLINGQKVPCLDNGVKRYESTPYKVDCAYSGKEAVTKGLGGSRKGLNFYATLIDQGGLVLERNFFGKFLERRGLTSLLPNQIRFRGVY